MRAGTVPWVQVGEARAAMSVPAVDHRTLSLGRLIPRRSSWSSRPYAAGRTSSIGGQRSIPFSGGMTFDREAATMPATPHARMGCTAHTPM